MQAQQCVNQLETIEKDKRLIDAFSELDEQQSKNQIIKKIKELKTKFNHKFTQKDQSLFEKLNEIETRFSDYQQKLQNLKQIQQDFDNLCEIMDKKAESLLQDQLYKRFAEYFRHYFLQIVTTGDCQIKLIKGLRKNNKKNWGIDIKVSFKNKEVQNWTSFSSGEKTIVAFVILISLQKCDPAPFYILDEFDAALDDNYRNQVAQIILNLSKESQYIIITFRPELISLTSDLVTFYSQQQYILIVQSITSQLVKFSNQNNLTRSKENSQSMKLINLILYQYPFKFSIPFILFFQLFQVVKSICNFLKTLFFCQ